MFVASYRFVLSAVFLYPLAALLTLAVVGAAMHLWLAALVWILLWLPIGVAAIYYYRNLRVVVGLVRRIAKPRSAGPISWLRRRIKIMLSTFTTSESTGKRDISA